MSSDSPFSRFAKEYTEVHPEPLPFDILSIQTHEKRLTRVLEWLFDSEGSHGAGRDYIEAFARAAGFPSVAESSFIKVDRFDVQTEGTKKTEIDLIIFTETACIGVEIKTGSDSETEAKLRKEAKRLHSKFGPHHELCFVYLTPHYHDSMNISLPAKLYNVHWAEVITELEQVDTAALNPEIRWFIQQFITTLRRFSVNNSLVLSQESEGYLYIYLELRKAREELEDTRWDLVHAIETRFGEEMGEAWQKIQNIGSCDFVHFYKTSWDFDPDGPPIRYAFSAHLKPELGPSLFPTIGIYLDLRGSLRRDLADAFENRIDPATLSSLRDNGFRTAPFGFEPDLHYLGTTIPLSSVHPIDEIFNAFQPLVDLEGFSMTSLKLLPRKKV